MDRIEELCKAIIQCCKAGNFADALSRVYDLQRCVGDLYWGGRKEKKP